MVDNFRASRGARASAACCNNSAAPSCNAQNGATPLLKKLQAIDFALTETVLYLDAYPHSKAALDYYHKLLCERERLCDALAKNNIPLTHRDNVSKTEWNWTNSPWPWHPDAN